MDQRTDTEHRLDAAPGYDINPAIGEARKTQPWLDRMRRRRRQVLVITALIIAAIVGTVAYWLNASGYESTDDAFIDARTVSVSAVMTRTCRRRRRIRSSHGCVLRASPIAGLMSCPGAASRRCSVSVR